MEKVLIISSNENATNAIVQLIKAAFPACNQSIIASSLEARRIMDNSNFDSIIINCPLCDEYGLELAEFVTQATSASCIVIVKAENCDAVGERLEDLGVMVVSKPLSKQLFYQALKLANSARQRLLGLQYENIKLHKKLEEIRNLNRAKLALMQYLSFTEQQAHRHIEKQAMDLRVTKNEVALKIIKMYEP